MARDEQVSYRCDVCGRKTTAQEVKPLSGQAYYVRPMGWGAVSGVVQVNGDNRVKDKWDFCSEECARKRFEELMDDAYQA